MAFKHAITYGIVHMQVNSHDSPSCATKTTHTQIVS